MLALLRRIEAQGPPRSVELSHQVGSGLWELVRGRLRVLWFYDEDRDLILTHGFVKRSRKTPAAEIARAAAYRASYRRAKAAGHLIIEEDE